LLAPARGLEPFALLHRIAAHEDERDHRACKLDQRAAEIGDAQFAMRRGGFFNLVIPRGGKDAVRRSVKRYIAIIEGDGTEQV
jgi:hypothetical protein